MLDRQIAADVLACEDSRRLMTLPGSEITATGIMAAVGDVSRCPTPQAPGRHLGLDPRVR